MPSRNKWGHEVHMYMRIEEGGPKKRILWRCMLPNCQHFLVGEFVLGKLCLCYRCKSNVFKMTPQHLEYKRPHCLPCTKGYKPKVQEREAPSFNDILSNLEDLLKVDDA